MNITGRVSRFNAIGTIILVVVVWVGFIIGAVWLCFGDVVIADGPPQWRYLFAGLFLLVPLVLSRELLRAVVWFEFDGRQLLARKPFSGRTIQAPLERITSVKTRWAGHFHTLYDVHLDDGMVLVFGHAGLTNAETIGLKLMDLKMV